MSEGGKEEGVRETMRKKKPYIYRGQGREQRGNMREREGRE